MVKVESFNSHRSQKNNSKLTFQENKDLESDRNFVCFILGLVWNDKFPQIAFGICGNL